MLQLAERAISVKRVVSSILTMLLGGQLCWEMLCFTLSVISII